MSDTFTIDEAGEPRIIGGALPVNPDVPALCKSYGTAGTGTRIIPKSQWLETDLSVNLPPVKDQDGSNACNAFASTSGMEATLIACGVPFVELSAGDIYKRINGGSDSGSLPEDALKELAANGICTTTNCGSMDFGRASQAAIEERKKYRLLEYLHCEDEMAVGSAIQQGFFVYGGLWWSDSDRVDSEGWLPNINTPNPVPRRGFGGHAVLLYGWTSSKGGGYRLRNSWSTRFGIDGNCIMPWQRVQRGSLDFRWFALRLITQSAGDFPAPKGV